MFAVGANVITHVPNSSAHRLANYNNYVMSIRGKQGRERVQDTEEEQVSSKELVAGKTGTR